MLRRLIPILSLIAVIILLVMLNFTTPAGVGPLGVLLFFGAMYMIFYALALLLVKFLGMIGGKKSGRKQYYYAVVVAFGPIMLLLAQSIGTDYWIALALMAVFVFLGCLLVSKKG